MSNTIISSMPYTGLIRNKGRVTRRNRSVTEANDRELVFRPITADNISQVWEILHKDSGRSCDFSYGGILMWADVFEYEYAILDDTLFIKGRSEDDMQSVAFSLPVGKMSLRESIAILSDWCMKHGTALKLTAVPEYAVSDLLALRPKNVVELDGWADYLYDIEKLATLSGKKMAKKRNHVNQFVNSYGNDCYERIDSSNLGEVEAFMRNLMSTPAPSAAAAIERKLAMEVLLASEKEQANYLGGLLRVEGRVVAFTIGDIKGDTLFIHIEKADRDISGSYEMINKAFAEDMQQAYPQLRFVNREDDSGDEGLRKAKMSYHPVELLRKFSVEF